MICRNYKLTSKKNSMAYSKNIFIKIVPQTRNNKNFAEYKKILKEVIKQNRCKKVNNHSKFDVSITFWFKNERRRVDLDNLSKPILDAFTGIVYKDDTQVFRLNLEKKYNEILEGISIKIVKN